MHSGPRRALRESVSRQTIGGRERDAPKNALRHHFIHEPHAQGLLRGRTFPGENHVERGAGADQPRQPLASTRPGDQAELNLGQAELGLGMIGGDSVVTREGQLEPSTETGAVNGGHHRLGERLDTADQLLALEAEPFRRGARGEGGELFDVGAGDERVRLAGDRVWPRESRRRREAG